MFAFSLESVNGSFFERCVDSFTGNVAQPRHHFPVRQCDVDGFGMLGLQRVEERFPEVPVESFDFALGLRAVRRAELDVEATVFGKVEQLAVELVFAFVVRVTLDDDCLGVVAQNVKRHAAKPVECSLQTGDECFGALVVGELDEWIARVPKLGGKRAQRRQSAPQDDKVDLQLMAGRRFEPDQSVQARVSV